MKADQIIKNAKIFTANTNNLQASALVVKDGKFIYVGDEAGLSAYEGEVSSIIENFTELGAGGSVNKFVKRMANSFPSLFASSGVISPGLKDCRK